MKIVQLKLYQNFKLVIFIPNSIQNQRETRICGDKGELRWDGSPFGPIIVYDFATRKETNIDPDNVISSAQG